MKKEKGKPEGLITMKSLKRNPTQEIKVDKICNVSIAISILTILLNLILNIEKVLSIF